MMTTYDIKNRISKHYNVHTLWVAMVLLTLSTYTMGEFEYSGAIAMLLILLIAGIKATIIIRDFMELRGVSLLWRIIMYGWLWVICVSIAISYIISI